MKICFISQAFGEYRGGNEIFTELFRRVKGTHQITVVTDRGLKSSPDFSVENISSHYPAYYYWLAGHNFSKLAVARVRELFQKEKFDCIVINQTIGRPLLTLLNLSVPIVYIVHHPVSVDIEFAQRESRSLFERLNWGLKYLGMAKTQKKLLAVFRYIITVSETSKQRIMCDYKVSSDKIEVIYNGIDTDFFKKTKDTKPHTVVAVGSYQHPRRGFRYLKKAYELLAADGFTIEDVGRRADAEARELYSIPGVQERALVSRQELPDLYSQAAVSISTSLYEGFGLSLLESLACQTPVVAFEGGAVSEILSVIDPDLVCPARDVTILVQKVKQLSADPNITERGREYRDNVIAYFSMDRMVQGYLVFFEKLTYR